MSLERLTSTLKDKKLRITQARKAIYQLLDSSEVSLSAKEVFSEVSRTDKNMDLASVYRNLQLFSDLGLIHRFQDGRFSNCHQKEHALGDSCGHIHIISHCKSCGGSREVESHSKDICQLAEGLKSLANSLNHFNEIVIQGECIRCSTT